MNIFKAFRTLPGKKSAASDVLVITYSAVSVPNMVADTALNTFSMANEIFIHLEIIKRINYGGLHDFQNINFLNLLYFFLILWSGSG